MQKRHLEIERKFLVQRLPRSLSRFPHRLLEQGYLVLGRGAHVRLRRSGRTHTLTFKRDTLHGREEREIHLSAAQFAKLWPATAGARLTKTRYDVAWKNLLVEIDIYNGINAGLIVAEVEFPNHATAHTFQPPPWLGAEVTGVRRYSNIRLAIE